MCVCVCVCVLCQGEREREREREYNSVCLCQWEREKNGKHLLLLFWIICLTDINSIDIKSWNKIGTIINQTSNDVELVYSLAADTADGGGHSRSESGDWGEVEARAQAWNIWWWRMSSFSFSDPTPTAPAGDGIIYTTEALCFFDGVIAIVLFNKAVHSKSTCFVGGFLFYHLPVSILPPLPPPPCLPRIPPPPLPPLRHLFIDLTTLLVFYRFVFCVVVFWRNDG